MPTPVFAGYSIKEIDGTKYPKEYKLSEGEQDNSYTVYLRLEPFKAKETHPFGVPPEHDSELRQFWVESLKKYVTRVIQNNTDYLFSGVEYFESEDGATLAVHGTTLEKIRADQADAEGKDWGSVLELLVYYPNGAMKDELNRRHWFRIKASEIKFQQNWEN